MGQENRPPTRDTLAAGLHAGPALSPRGREPHALPGFPGLAEGFFQLVSVGRVALLQVL